MNIVDVALPVLSAVLLFRFRNLLRVPLYIVQGRPIRIDLPLPYLQLDVVLVSKPHQIQVGSACYQAPTAGETNCSKTYRRCSRKGPCADP